MTYTIADFHKEFTTLQAKCQDYRIGQHFINKFIKVSTSNEMCTLWNEWYVEAAYITIHKIIERNCWDYYDLPVLPEGK